MNTDLLVIAEMPHVTTDEWHALHYLLQLAVDVIENEDGYVIVDKEDLLAFREGAHPAYPPDTIVALVGFAEGLLSNPQMREPGFLRVYRGMLILDVQIEMYSMRVGAVRKFLRAVRDSALKRASQEQVA